MGIKGKPGVQTGYKVTMYFLKLGIHAGFKQIFN